MLTKDLLGSGISGGAAQAITGFVSLAQTASGATQNAQTIPTAIVVYTSSTASYGPTLPLTASPGDTYMLTNNTANTINVWPPTGGKVNNLSANAADTILAGRSAYYVALGQGDFVHVQGAAA